MSQRPNLVTIDAGAFARNIGKVRAGLRRSVDIFQVCKGDGYGLGVENAVRLGLAAGIRAFCVGDPDEALRAREVAPAAEILLFPSALPQALAPLAARGITLTAHNRESLHAILEAGAEARFFFKVETGLSRYGFCEGDWADVLGAYARTGWTSCRGVYSHLGQAMREHAGESLKRFDGHLRVARRHIRHDFASMVASSLTLCAHPDLPCSAVDPGRLLYGMLSGDECPAFRTEPVVERISSRLLQVTGFEKGQRVRIGYADGIEIPAGGRIGVFPIGTLDGLSSGNALGEVLIGGQPAKAIGRTLMHSIVDLGRHGQAAVGDEVVLVGRQANREISLLQCAQSMNTSVTALHFSLVRNLPKLVRAEKAN